MSRDGLGIARRYAAAADYSGPPLAVGADQRARIHGLVAEVYGDDRADGLTDAVIRLLRVHHAHSLPDVRDEEQAFDPRSRFSERDVILITYGDLILSDEDPPLQTLARFADEFFRGLITTIHVLPFYPWSSDRGFSVLSYWLVDRNLGTWDDIARLNDSFRLMFDGVFNHASRHSRWFQEYRADHPDFRDYFIGYDSPQGIPTEDLEKVLRPRTSPLLTETDTVRGPRWVWTTFSEDQVDLNFASPRVLLEILSLLLYYVRRGADLIRLDAVTYLWKELGTSCAHHPKTHACIRLLRAALDVAAPRVALVTETNVPHADNVSYFGSGEDEAQMVYNFALPPLVLHAFQTGDASALTRWAADLETPSPTTCFLNFLSSHDGIGLMGARDILTEAEIDEMCRRVEAHGGLVSMRSDPDRGESPYELNVTWFSALNAERGGESLELRIARFIASRAVALVLKGVPGVYLPSLIGSRNDREAVARTESKRDINRAAIDERALRRLLANPQSPARLISDRYLRLLQARVSEPAFHPASAQDVLDLGPEVFALVRGADTDAPVLSLIGTASRPTSVQVDVAALDLDGELVDAVGGDTWMPRNGVVTVELSPYQVLWLKESGTD